MSSNIKKYKKYITKIIICLSISALISCDDFLDVYPEDRLVWEQIASSERTINMALNGIYMQMSNNILYGADLSMSTIECMAQRYNLAPSDHPFHLFGRYEYEDAVVERKFSAIWEAMYAQILAINDFISLVNDTDIEIHNQRRNTLLGEAYGLRAFHHFDLLRIFGPIYNSDDSTSLTMPYNDTGDGLMLDLLPANVVMQKILDDLEIAAQLLQSDPIIGEGVIKETLSDPVGNFYTNRHYRMNFYAVKTLQARAYLWRGSKQSAYDAANVVWRAARELPNPNQPLVENVKMFPWTQPGSVTRHENPDRIFSTEVIFGIHNRNMYGNQSSFFGAGLSANRELCPLPSRLQAIFENENDYRFQNIWRIINSEEKNYRTFLKFAERNSASPEVDFANFQPLIRIAEIYYIIAECAPTTREGSIMLTKIRRARGLTREASEVNLEDEIRSEYVREFFGEGQLFYYYKRKAFETIPDGNSDNGTIPVLSAQRYRVPLPLNEIDAR